MLLRLLLLMMIFLLLLILLLLLLMLMLMLLVVWLLLLLFGSLRGSQRALLLLDVLKRVGWIRHNTHQQRLHRVGLRRRLHWEHHLFWGCLGKELHHAVCRWWDWMRLKHKS
jgi:hypothetical protein